MPFLRSLAKKLFPKVTSDSSTGRESLPPKVVLGASHEAAAAYDVTYGAMLGEDAVHTLAAASLSQDNIPAFLALLRRYPDKLSQSFVEETMLHHPNLGKLGFEITQLEPRNLPLQIANLIDTDMDNGQTTFVSSYNNSLIRSIAEELRQMPRGGEQDVIVSRGEEEYWDAKADTYHVRSMGGGRISVVPTNASAREAVADPDIPTFDDMMEDSSQSPKEEKEPSFFWSAVQPVAGTSASSTLLSFSLFKAVVPESLYKLPTSIEEDKIPDWARQQP